MIYIIFVLIAYIAYQDFMNRKERRRLTDAFMAKNLEELNRVEPKPTKLVQPKLEDIPITEASPEDFDKAIKKELGREPVGEKIKSAITRAIRHGKS